MDTPQRSSCRRSTHYRIRRKGIAPAQPARRDEDSGDRDFCFSTRAALSSFAAPGAQKGKRALVLAGLPLPREGGSESSEDGDLDPYLLELVHAKLALLDLPLPKL
jgi:hypothetical protein